MYDIGLMLAFGFECHGISELVDIANVAGGVEGALLAISTRPKVDGAVDQCCL